MKPFLRIALPAALLALHTPAEAQKPTQAQASAIRQSCRADYQSHCASISPGGTAALQCLQQNAAALSVPCQQALAAVGGGGMATPGNTMMRPTTPATSQAPMSQPPVSRRQAIAALRADCRADYRRYCSGVRPGGGRAIACLKAYGPRLSPQCQSALLAARQSR